jgi:hypothetical protein
MEPYKWEMKTICSQMHSNETCNRSSTLGYDMDYLWDAIHPSIYGCKVLYCAKLYVVVKQSKGKASDFERVL